MEATFVKLLMEHRSRLHSFIYALLRDPHLTEDVLQEMAVVLWEKFPDFRPGSDFAAWARDVAYREIMSARRAEWRARRPLNETFARAIWTAYQRRRDVEPPPAERREALRRCLDTLEAGLRRVLDWRYAAGWSSERIGSELRRTAQAVDAMIYRTKRSLEDCVKRRVAEGSR